MRRCFHAPACSDSCARRIARRQAAVPAYYYELVKTYPHDTQAFTEGLFYLNGFLYESTGLEVSPPSARRSWRPARSSRRSISRRSTSAKGIVNWKNHLVSLTWKSQVGFVYDLNTLKLQRHFTYKGEGWALTQDGKRLIMSDGTPDLRFLDPETLKETGRITVTYDGQPVPQVNELEWVKGRIYANVWHTDMLIIIDPDARRYHGSRGSDRADAQQPTATRAGQCSERHRL